MPHLDVFNGDAFSLHSLTAAINELPHVPGRIGAMGLFEEQGVTTTVVTIERQGHVLSLVPSLPRGAPATPKGTGGRTMKAFVVPHLPQRSSILADEVQNVRAFGSEDQAEAVQQKVQSYQAVHRRDLDATIEYHRVGAIKGQILNSNGETLYDLFTEFGVAQSTHVLALANDATKTKEIIRQAIRKSEDVLGGTTVTGYVGLCGRNFFDAFTGNKKVEEAYNRWQDGEFLRTDNRNGFPFGEVQWSEYRGKVGNTAFIGDNEAYLVPLGVPGLFITRFAPADYMEAVNTTGLPYYSKIERMPFDKGVELESQSNALNLCTRPAAIVKLTLS